MPSNGTVISNVFAAQAGPIPLAQLDADLAGLAAFSNALANYANYFVDSSGAANAITITVPSPLVVSYVAGTSVEVKIANTNVAPTTININSMGVKAVVNADGAALQPGQLLAGGVYKFIYDGTNFQIESVNATRIAAFKVSDETRTVAVLANDSALQLSLAAGIAYKVSALIPFYASTGTGNQGFQEAFAFSGSISGTVTPALISGVVNAAAISNYITSLVSTTTFYASISTLTNANLLVVQGSIHVNAAGTLAFKWAANTNNGSATTVLAGAYLVAEAIG